MANVRKIYPEVLPDAHTTTGDFVENTGMADAYQGQNMANPRQTVRSNEQMMQSMKGATSESISKIFC